MANNNLFGYTPAQSGTMVNTQPFMVNQNRAKSAADDIVNLLKTGLSVAGDIKEDMDKTSLINATNEVKEVDMWYSEELAKNKDNPYKQSDILNQYEIALKSIEEGYELKGEYQNTFRNSNHRYLREQKNIIGNRVQEQMVKDTDISLENLSSSLITADTKELIPLMKEATVAYTNLNLPKEEASDRVASIFVKSKLDKIATAGKDIIYTDLNSVQSDINTLIEGYDPFLKNKKLQEDVNTTILKLKDEQYRTAKSHLSSLVLHENTTQKMFDSEIDKFKHILNPVEIDNYKSDKAEKVFNLKIQKQTRAEAALNDYNKIFTRNLKAILTDPYETIEAKHEWIKQAKDRGVYTEKEADTVLNKLAKTEETAFLSAEEEKRKAEVQAAKDSAKGYINHLKTSKSYKDTDAPDLVAGYITIKNGGLSPSVEDLKFLADYKVQWELENSPEKKANLVNVTQSQYIGEQGEKGYVKAINNYINELFDGVNTPNGVVFSPETMLKVYNNHRVTGNVIDKLKDSINNPDTAIDSVLKFNSMKAVDPTLTREMLGDGLYSQLNALSTRTTRDPKTEQPIISGNDFREIKEIAGNPLSYEVDMSKFTDEVKSDPRLAQFRDTFKTRAAFKEDVDDIIKDLKERVNKLEPVTGIKLKGYTEPVSEDAKSKLELLPKALNFINDGAVIGIAYNPYDKLFYYSSPTDDYAAKITATKADGTKETFSKLSDVVFFIDREVTKYNKGTTAYKIDSIIRGIPDWLLSLNPPSHINKEGKK